MASATEQERQAFYQADLDIINSIADNKIQVLKANHEAFNRKEQAAVDKLIASKKAQRDTRKGRLMSERDRILESVKPGQEYKLDNIKNKYNGLIAMADDAYEDWFDDASEAQYKKDGRRKEREELEIERVEKWRLAEIAKEAAQLAAHTQRQRRH